MILRVTFDVWYATHREQVVLVLVHPTLQGRITFDGTGVRSPDMLQVFQQRPNDTGKSDCKLYHIMRKDDCHGRFTYTCMYIHKHTLNAKLCIYKLNCVLKQGLILQSTCIKLPLDLETVSLFLLQLEMYPHW